MHYQGAKNALTVTFEWSDNNLTNSAKRIQLDRLQAEYERLDKVLFEVIADMAVLKYELDLLETTEN